jgi:sigma-B regulation protein RsbU (phosphoserine phosphatase)
VENAQLTNLQRIDELVKELSFQDDPDRLVRVFGRDSDLLLRRDGLVTVSRRDLERPLYRITRSWRWREAINPWTDAHLLPIVDRGLLGELLNAGKPLVIPRLEVAGDDPGRDHLEGMQSLACAPAYERGQAVNMVMLLRREPHSFTSADLETLLLHANLLGRAASNLLLAQQLQEAYDRLDQQMEQVGRMQRHLLPPMLPRIEGLELGAAYVTCHRAGGDYYDVLPLPDGQWGLFLADVSGHGVAAAVVMAMLHTLLHAYPGPPLPPENVLAHFNRHLLAVAPEEMFATAFYGVYDAERRRLRYTCAGHPPPRLRRGAHDIHGVGGGRGMPLGIDPTTSWTEDELILRPGDALLLYTDGIIEGINRAGKAFGVGNLDEALRQGPPRAAALVQHIDRRYRDHCDGAPALDDRTLLAAVAVP